MINKILGNFIACCIVSILLLNNGSARNDVIARPKIIVSLTTIDSRIDQIEPTIKCLFAQTLKPDSIELYISDHPTLFEGGLDNGIVPNKIPVALKKYESEGKIKIKYTDNIGPARKLLPCLRENWGTDTVIITVDDDARYPKDLVELLYKHYEREQCAVALSGRVPLFDNEGLVPLYETWKDIRKISKGVHLLARGKGGCLYKPRFFTDMIFDKDLMFWLAPTADDLWFYFMRIVANTPIVVLGKDWHVKDFEIGDPLLRLGNINREYGKGMNNVYLTRVIDFFKKESLGFLLGKQSV